MANPNSKPTLGLVTIRRRLTELLVEVVLIKLVNQTYFYDFTSKLDRQSNHDFIRIVLFHTFSYFFWGWLLHTHIYIYRYIDINKYIGNRQPPQKNAIVSCRFSCDRQGYWSLAYPGYAYAMPACAGYAGTGSSVADHGKMLGTHGKCWENVCLNP